MFRENISEVNSKDNIECDNIESNKKQKLANMKIVFTGFRSKELEDEIIKNGGLVVNNINSRTNILIVNRLVPKSGKMIKADQLNIKIVTREQFRKKYLE